MSIAVLSSSNNRISIQYQVYGISGSLRLPCEQAHRLGLALLAAAEYERDAERIEAQP